jgi:exocyst complex protein 7
VSGISLFEHCDTYANNGVAILSSFDSRLGRLEKSIQPVYTIAQLLTRRSNSAFGIVISFSMLLMCGADIEAALVKIDEVASNQEGIAAEEALILRGYASLLDHYTSF